MSLFLGPIHHWLFNKINIQNNITNKILRNLGNEELNMYLKQNYGELESGKLEDLIETSNIHGWLQERVVLVENRLAYTITKLLNEDKNNLKKMKEIFFEEGKNISIEFNTNDASSVFKAIDDSLLDGMPCDRAKIILEKNENVVKWKQNKCVHKDYWDKVNGDVKIYYELINEFIKGIITKTKFNYRKENEEFIIM